MSQHPEYWKIKSAFLAAQKARADAELMVVRAEAQLGFVMKMAGLNPELQYELNDNDESIIEREKTAQPAPV